MTENWVRPPETGAWECGQARLPWPRPPWQALECWGALRGVRGDAAVACRLSGCSHLVLSLLPGAERRGPKGSARPREPPAFLPVPAATGEGTRLCSVTTVPAAPQAASLSARGGGRPCPPAPSGLGVLPRGGNKVPGGCPRPLPAPGLCARTLQQAPGFRPSPRPLPAPGLRFQLSLHETSGEIYFHWGGDYKLSLV